MKDWLSFYLCALIAVWLLLAATRSLLRLRSQPPRRVERPELPTGHGLRGLARLLAATNTRAYSRERVQERLRLLATDLAALEGTIAGPGPRAENPESLDASLYAYFAEDHVGFRGTEYRKHTLDPDFLRRTEAVIQRLERRGHLLQGDPP